MNSNAELVEYLTQNSVPCSIIIVISYIVNINHFVGWQRFSRSSHCLHLSLHGWFYLYLLKVVK